MRALTLCCATLFLAVCNISAAQEYTYGTDLIFDEELGMERLSGALNGGYATAYMGFMLDGNTLSSVLRNTSPDADNWGGDSTLGSPAVTKIKFEAVTAAGSSATLATWELRALDQNENEVILGRNGGGSSNLWKISQLNDGTFRLNSKRSRREARAPIYNPNATGGFATTGDQFFTDAVFTATFNTNLGSADLNSTVRFEYIGSPGVLKTLSGVSLPTVIHQPEPGSLVVWAVGGILATACYRRRRRRISR